MMKDVTCLICKKDITDNNIINFDYYSILVDDCYRNHKQFIHKIGLNEYNNLTQKGWIPDMINKEAVFIIICSCCSKSKKDASEIAHNYWSFFEKL